MAMSIRTFLTGTAVSVAMVMGMAPSAQAALVSVNLPETASPGEVNDCSGIFGTAPDCNVTGPAPTNTPFSPLIVKYDMDGATGTTIVLTTINTKRYPTFGGSEIVFGGGSWTYTPTPGEDDPGIKYWTAKAGPSFNLFWNVDDAEVLSGGACYDDVYTDACLSKALVVTSGTYETPDKKNLSHIGFYNTGDEQSVVPLPAAAWLLLSGLLGLGALGRRKASA